MQIICLGKVNFKAPIIISYINVLKPILILSIKIHCNPPLPPMLKASKWSLPFRLSEKKNVICISHLSHACCMPFLLILLDFITLTTFGTEYKL
jgi:hypothetical protein